VLQLSKCPSSNLAATWLQRVAVCCTVWLCVALEQMPIFESRGNLVAVCFSVLQLNWCLSSNLAAIRLLCVAVSTCLQYVAYSSMLQCVVVHGSVRQCVAVCETVLQCVAVCDSV